MRVIDRLNKKDKVLELRLQKLTYQEIGNELGISRQRVHQLLTGYSPPRWREHQRNYKKRASQTEEFKARHRKESKRFRDRVKILVLTHYAKGKLACVQCGFNDIRALSIDHMDGGGSNHKKSLGLKSNTFYQWLVANGYPDSYQTLCMNCQFIKRVEHDECKKIPPSA